MAEEKKDQHGDGHGEEHKDGHKKGGHGPPHGGGHEEHGGVAEWLISFADNVALLMGFFVILLAMNMAKPKMGGLGGDTKNPGGGENDPLNELVYGIRNAFNNLPSPDSKDPKEIPLIQYMERRSKGQTSTFGMVGLKQEQAAIRPSNYNAPTGSFGFEPYSTTIDSAGRALALDIANHQRGQNYIIEVRGHASSLEASGGVEAVMKLCYQRANVVAALLVQNGMKWQNLRIVQCGDHERVTPIASDKAEHKTNQRVEIVVTNETIAADPHLGEGNGREKEIERSRGD